MAISPVTTRRTVQEAFVPQAFMGEKSPTVCRLQEYSNGDTALEGLAGVPMASVSGYVLGDPSQIGQLTLGK